jgi:hypothetical protein
VQGVHSASVLRSLDVRRARIPSGAATSHLVSSFPPSFRRTVTLYYVSGYEISECGFFLIPIRFFELHFESIQAAAAALSPLLREFNTIPVGELRDNAVVTLDLYRNGVGVVGALALGLLLRTNTSLARLELSEEDITADGKDWSGVAALAAALTGGWEAEEGTAMETKNANREIRVWHGATETGPLMMDKSETLWHDWRSCRYITLCRGVLDFPIIQ